MLMQATAQDISGKTGKSGDIYRFDSDNFWGGTWIEGGLKERKESKFIRITKREYLILCSEVPKSGCVTLKEKSHAALYKLLIARSYPHFGVAGIKALYLIMCIEGEFGEKYRKTTSHDAIKKLIGGRADVSHASQQFWDACYERIKQEDLSERENLKLKEFTPAEREIWRAFVRRGSISCNRKKILSKSK